MNSLHRSRQKLVLWAVFLGLLVGIPSARADCPAARAGHVAVYDPIGQAMVMFGGTNGTYLGLDVWTLSLPAPGSGTPTWNFVMTGVFGGGPGKAIDGSAVWDSERNRMVYFGGRDFSNATNEIWVLNTSTPAWTQVTVTGTPPPAQSGHTAIWDPVRNRMVTFGGDGTNTWEFAFTGAFTGTWTLLTTTGTPPVARTNHTSVYDTQFNRMVISGGSPEKNTMVLTLPASGPKVWSQPWVGYWNQRKGQSMTWDPVWNRMLGWGGEIVSCQTNTGLVVMANYQGSPTTYSYGNYQNLSGTPNPRRDHTQIYDALNQRIIVFGGSVPCSNPTTYFSQTYQFSTAPWNPYESGWSLMGTCGGSDPEVTFESEAGPASTALRIVGANPFSSSTKLALSVPIAARVQVEVFDLAGRRIATLADREFEPGEHLVEWDGHTTAGARARPGVYHARMRVGANIHDRTLVLQP